MLRSKSGNSITEPRHSRPNDAFMNTSLVSAEAAGRVYSSTENEASGAAESAHTQPPKILAGSATEQLQWYAPPRRSYSRRELLADRVVNFFGAGLSWLAALILGYSTWLAKDPALKQMCFWMHGLGLVTMLNCSALYHYWAWDWKHAKQLLCLDHIGISAMISGCYAPLMLQADCLRTLAIVCLMGLAVVPMEALQLKLARQSQNDANWNWIDILHIIRYLVMGWACLPVMPEMVKAIPAAAASPIVIGGLIYTVGILVFIRSFEFHLAIWHFGVLVASACFYFTNLLVLVGVASPAEI